MVAHTGDVQQAVAALGPSVPLMTRLRPERTFTAILHPIKTLNPKVGESVLPGQK